MMTPSPVGVLVMAIVQICGEVSEGEGETIPMAESGGEETDFPLGGLRLLVGKIAKNHSGMPLKTVHVPREYLYLILGR